MGKVIKRSDSRFDALLTVDQGIEYQQDLSGLSLGLVVLLGGSNDIDDLRRLLPATLAALAAILPGQVVKVGP